MDDVIVLAKDNNQFGALKNNFENKTALRKIPV